MIHEALGRELQDIDFPNRVPLQELQCGLLASLPLRDRLEAVDVPTNDGGEGGLPLVRNGECPRGLEFDLAPSSPVLGGGLG